MTQSLTSMTRRRAHWMLAGALGAALAAGIGIYWVFLTPSSSVPEYPWGAAPAQIREQETAAFQAEQPNTLIYQTKLLHIPVALGYYFSHNELNLVRYVPLRREPTPEEARREFLDLQQVLEQQHGKPAASEQTAASRTLIWQTPHSRISLFFDNATLKWVLEYAGVRD